MFPDSVKVNSTFAIININKGKICTTLLDIVLKRNSKTIEFKFFSIEWELEQKKLYNHIIFISKIPSRYAFSKFGPGVSWGEGGDCPHNPPMYPPRELSWDVLSLLSVQKNLDIQNTNRVFHLCEQASVVWGQNVMRKAYCTLEQ